MNNIFKIVSTLLMIILILILIWVLVNYYKQDPYKDIGSSNTITTPVGNNEDNTPALNENTNNETETNNDKTNEENNINENNNSDENTNPASNTENDLSVIEPMNTPSNNIPETKDPVVITTSEQISNTEKQEVLNEIDKALMDLLQVVDKVKPVDETRLGIDESEVQ